MKPEDTPVPLWQKLAAVLYVVVAVVLVVVFRSHLHADFIPVDGSRVAPNLLASFIIVVVMTPVGVLVWPPTRRRIHRFMDRYHAALHERHDQLAASHDELHAKVDRLLKHLEVPD